MDYISHLRVKYKVRMNFSKSQFAKMKDFNTFEMLYKNYYLAWRNK